MVILFFDGILEIAVIELVDPLGHHPSHFFPINPRTKSIIRSHQTEDFNLRKNLFNMADSASPHQQLGAGRVVLVGDDGQEGVGKKNPHCSKGFGLGGCWTIIGWRRARCQGPRRNQSATEENQS